MKRHYLLLILPLFSLNASAQMLVGTAGGVQQGDNVQLSYSVGEPVIETLNGAVVLTQGFQQVEAITTDIPEGVNDLEFTLYPNPCVDQLFLSVEEPGSFELEIFDMQGRIVLYQQTGFSTLNVLDVNPLTSGSYVLRIRKSGNDQPHVIQFLKSR